MYREDWNIGVVAQPAADIVRRGITVPIHWLALPRAGTMQADPACQLHGNGGFTLFAEVLDHQVNRGEIWSARIPSGGDPVHAVLEPLLALPYHMSYPFPFEDESGWACLTAETWQAGQALLWRNEGQWRSAGALFPGGPAVDPTLWRGPDRWWLFCTFQDDSPNERLYLFHCLRLGDPWVPHRKNPVKVDLGSGRCAGPIFRVDGSLIRPAQDCSSTYGGAVVLNAIRQIDPDGFIEEPVRRLGPVPGPYANGLHTFCPAGEVTFVDGKHLRLDLAGVTARARARFGPVREGLWRASKAGSSSSECRPNDL